jgi:hypothetical protein
MDMRNIARGLGWFSLALGAAELLAPRRLSGMLGLDDHSVLIRSYGLREIGAGIGLLMAARPAPWLWARVAGDALDLGSLGAARRSTPRAGAMNAAIAGVAAVTALDIAAASRLRQRKRNWLGR